MLTRFFLVALLALLCEGGVFAYSYRDLLGLRQTRELTTPSEQAEFVQYAEQALARPKVTRAHLELIAARAQTLGNKSLEIRALDACATLDPNDVQLTLRRADAARRAGDLRRAELLYADVLRRTGRRAQ
ncbi:MAG: hypothetical protein U0Q11_06120 [Vicinamibacterales bacterium]